jgi:DNA-directed RNA polymerase specialized sigma24 family protein
MNTYDPNGLSQEPSAAPTDPFLLTRIMVQDNERYWPQFVERYHPLIVDFGRRRGLKERDAESLAQDVFATIVRTIKSSDYNPAAGGFRCWLFKLASEQMLSFLKKE